VLYGDDQAVNNLWGLAGNDRIYGGGGYDVMIGDAGADHLDGGAGRDEADYETSPVGVIASLADPSINTGHAQGDVYVDIEDLAGSQYDDVLYGDQFDNNILGWPGLDTLRGGAGNDGLEGGPGADHLDGGDGFDLAGYSTAGTAPGFAESYTTLGVGVTASLLNPSINTGEAAGDTYVSIENLEGSGFADRLHGDNLANSVFGLAGADYLNGEGGDDLLEGGAGADALDGGLGFDYAVYTRSTVGVIASLGGLFVNTGDAQGDTYVNIEGLMGSAFGDVLAGDDHGNRLQGGDGADSLYGGGGDDFLYGGAGADQMDGGAGVDTVSYQTASAGVTVSLQNAALNTGEAAGDTYGAIEQLEGSQFDDELHGYAFASNQLYGGGGDDRLFGGAAADVLIGNSGADHMDGGAGRDMVSYVTSTTGVVADMLSPQGGQGDGFGDSFVDVEDLAGSQFGDILSGDGQGNVILGLGGGDYLFGRGGDDSFEGGLGGDYLDGGDGVDTASYGNAVGGVRVSLLIPTVNTGEAAGDTFHSIENLIGSGFDDELIGGEGQNTFFGGLGADTLRGGDGNDLLEGGAGGDSLRGDEGYDYASYTRAAEGVTVFMGGPIYNAGEAAGDTYTSIEGVLGSNFADLIGGDNSSNVIQGYGGNDWLLGIGGDDWLIGGDGYDLLEGGLGHDILEGGDSLDVASYRNATAGVTVNFRDHMQNAGEAFGDTYKDIENIWGSDHADVIVGHDTGGQVYGFDGNDYLFGYGGNDNLYGGGGIDQLSGGTGADTFFFLQMSEGGDTISDFVSGQDLVFASQYWFGFTVQAPGRILDSQFVAGTTPAGVGPAPQFLWDTDDCKLYYDQDGAGGMAPVLLATFAAGTTMTAADIWTA
jgi:Ca2+-binding RTX toxin-like protein